MKRLALILTILSLTVPALASANILPHPGQAQGVRVAGIVGATPVTLRSRDIPATAVLTFVNCRFNGHQARHVWLDSTRQVEYAWHGVIVTVNVSKKRGPLVVRMASTRPLPTRVVVRAGWSA